MEEIEYVETLPRMPVATVPHKIRITKENRERLLEAGRGLNQSESVLYSRIVVEDPDGNVLRYEEI